jgi:hypothetical protein
VEVTSSSLVPPIAFAPLAQLDRAFDYGSKGWGFESLRAHLVSCNPAIAH